MRYSIKNGAIYSKNGFPLPKQWFADGRLAFSYDKIGVDQIEYFIPTAKDGNRIIFKRNIFDCFRPSIQIGDRRYTPDYANLYIMPYGLECDFTAENETYKLGVYAVESNIVFSLSGGKPCDFRLTLFETTQFIPAYNGDLDSRDYGLKREWKSWNFAENAVYGGMSETEKEDKIALSSQHDSAVFSSLMQKAENVSHGLNFGVTASGKMLADKTKINARLECLLPHSGEKTSYFAVVFAANDKDIKIETEKFINRVEDSVEKQKARYKSVCDKLPQIKTGIRAIDDFCKIAPLFHESTKADKNGIIRAKTSRYWSWGWDSMVSNDTTIACWQDGELIRGMLDYFEQTADEEKGWAHWFRPDNSIRQYATPAAQGIYISLLFDYYNTTGDKVEVEKHYAFAKKIFYKLLKIEKDGTGLFISPSLVPDYPECVRETGRDLSLFNNSVAYSALRGMEKLAAAMGDSETEERSRITANHTEENFFKTFYDDGKGFLAFSADADDLKKRDVYSICGYFWDSDFHDELLGKKVNSVIDFIVKNGVNKLAFINYVLWGKTYDGDANQLHATWGVVEEDILRIARYTGHNDLIDHWINKLTYWMDKLTCPEGESYEYETDDPGYDRWNCDAGSWQTYTIRKWYRMIVGIILGVSFDMGGVTLSAPVKEYSIKNLEYLGKKWEIKTTGKGDEIEYIAINGKILRHTGKIPADLLNKPVNKAVVSLCGKKQSGILKADGVTITNYKECENGDISFTAQGVASCGLFIKGKYDIFVDGGKVETEKTDICDEYFRVVFDKDKTYRIEMKR